MEKRFFVYLLASHHNGTLYIGVTSNLTQRVWQHKEKQVEGFTKQYGVNQLVWFEEHSNAEAAITREKQLKKWKREWKVALSEEKNPRWVDLYPEILD
ncbi:MAG: GIY-YIG nuclease family protein [Planctomycetota bacterium]